MPGWLSQPVALILRGAQQCLALGHCIDGLCIRVPLWFSLLGKLMIWQWKIFPLCGRKGANPQRIGGGVCCWWIVIGWISVRSDQRWKHCPKKGWLWECQAGDGSIVNRIQRHGYGLCIDHVHEWMYGCVLYRLWYLCKVGQYKP